MSHQNAPFFPSVVGVVHPNVAKAGRSPQAGVLPCLAEEEGGGGGDGTVRTASLAGAA